MNISKSKKANGNSVADTRGYATHPAELLAGGAVYVPRLSGVPVSVFGFGAEK